MTDNELGKLFSELETAFGDSVVVHENKEDFAIIAKESANNFSSWVDACGYNDAVFETFARYSKDVFEVLLYEENYVVKVGAIGNFPSKDGGFVEVGIGIPFEFTLNKGQKVNNSEFFLDALLVLFQLAGKMDSFMEEPVYVKKVRTFAEKYKLV